MAVDTMRIVEELVKIGPNEVCDKISFYYEKPKKKITFYAFEQLVCSLKTYNGIKL